MPQNHAQLLAGIADPEREFGLLATAESTLAAPAFKALKAACEVKGLALPKIWHSHSRGKRLPEGCFIIMVRQ